MTDLLSGFAELTDGEKYWKDRYNWLAEHGYRLRDRYQPEWIPSWEVDRNLVPGETEDSQSVLSYSLMDAIRTDDNCYVVMKRVSRGSEEVEIMRFLNQTPQLSNPRNHAVKLLDVLDPPDDPNHQIVVMPVLRSYDSPDFDTVGEGLDFLRQILQGLSFLHENGVAHRDIRSSNFLMDGKNLYSSQFRAFEPHMKLDFSGPVDQISTRTMCWPRYHIIDFEFSKKYAPEDDPSSEPPKRTTDQTVPEFQDKVSCNPFPVDVYTFGNLIRSDFLDGGSENSTYRGRKGFEFLRPLVNAMTESEPAKRITMLQALQQFDGIVATLGEWKLRSRPLRLYGKTAPRPGTVSRIQATTSHWTRKLKYVYKRVPPMPPKHEGAAGLEANDCIEHDLQETGEAVAEEGGKDDTIGEVDAKGGIAEQGDLSTRQDNSGSTNPRQGSLSQEAK